MTSQDQSHSGGVDVPENSPTFAGTGPSGPRTLCIIDTVGAGGGAEQLMASLIPEMKAQGADIEVAALFDWPESLADQMRSKGVVVHELHLREGRIPVGALAPIRSLAGKRPFDLYWGHLHQGNLAAVMASMGNAKTRSVITLHSEGHAGLTKPTLSDRFQKLSERFLLFASDSVVAVSDAVKTDYETCFGTRGIQIAHNGVEVAQVQALASGHSESAARAHFGYTDADFLIVTPARYVDKKGHVHLFEALRQLRDDHGFSPKLFCCGVGPLKAALGAKVAALDLAEQVTVSDVIPHDCLFPLMKAAEAVVMPSLREPFGIAAAEAMAAGAACILTEVDGFMELVGAERKAAMLVPPANAAGLAAALLHFRDSPAFAAQIAAAGMARIESHFGIAHCAARWRDILSGVHLQGR